jgi:uncharacterized protein YlxW (UPF0749 family)
MPEEYAEKVASEGGPPSPLKVTTGTGDANGVPDEHGPPAGNPADNPADNGVGDGVTGGVDKGAVGVGDDVVRQRLRQALVRPSRGQAIVGLLLAVLGFAAITQVRTNNTGNTYAGYREQDLVDVLSGLAGTSQQAQTEIDALEATRRNLEARQQSAALALAAATKQEQELSILAGSVPVTGPGIRVTVTEGPRPVTVDSVLDAIEELRSAGAEAMQINGKVRLVAQSSVQTAPGGLNVDGTLLSSPFVLDAIGDPHTLQGALSLIDGPITQFEAVGAHVDVQQEKALDITAVHKPSTP